MTSKLSRTIVVYSITLAVLFQFANASIITAIACFLAGLLTFNLFEYGMHRFLFHLKFGPASFRRTVTAEHMHHHRNPNSVDDLIINLWVTLPIILAVLAVFIAVVGLEYAFWFQLGVVAMYFFYEFMHYSAHHLRLNSRFLRYMRTYHLTHHHKATHAKYMITWPGLDWLFKT